MYQNPGEGHEMPDIELRHVSKAYGSGKIVAMEDVSLFIKHGEYVFLLGPSGCGKTTTLRVIAGLEHPDRGDVLIDNKDVKLQLPEDRGMGFVFQHFEIFPFMTVWENCVYGLEVRGYEDDYIIEHGERALKTVGLLGYADDYPNTFGNPGLQRLGIARAIATGAKVLIMDEPLGSLDPKARLSFRHELRDLVKKIGLTAIQVTHDQDEALAIGDKIIVMRQGRMLQVGTPHELYTLPKSLFVANFIGEMNFLEGFIYPNALGNNFLIRLEMRGPKLYASKEHAISPDYAIDQRVVVAFRFEDVYVFPQNFDFNKVGHARMEQELNFIPAKLSNVRFVGKTTRFVAKFASGEIIQATKPGTFPHMLSPGDPVLLGIHPHDLITFEHPSDLKREIDLS